MVTNTYLIFIIFFNEDKLSLFIRPTISNNVWQFKTRYHFLYKISTLWFQSKIDVCMPPINLFSFYDYYKSVSTMAFSPDRLLITVSYYTNDNKM